MSDASARREAIDRAVRKVQDAQRKTNPDRPPSPTPELRQRIERAVIRGENRKS